MQLNQTPENDYTISPNVKILKVDVKMCSLIVLDDISINQKNNVTNENVFEAGRFVSYNIH